MKYSNKPCKSGQHNWFIQTDWIGDTDVVNGTMTFEIAKCSKCGDESTSENDMQAAYDNVKESEEQDDLEYEKYLDSLDRMTDYDDAWDYA